MLTILIHTWTLSLSSAHSQEARPTMMQHPTPQPLSVGAEGGVELDNRHRMVEKREKSSLDASAKPFIPMMLRLRLPLVTFLCMHVHARTHTHTL